MRNAILRMPEQRTAGEQRQVLRTAIRQLERAEIYLAAIASLDLGDRAAKREVEQIRIDMKQLLRYLSDKRARIDV
jgi:hypothetical protein